MITLQQSSLLIFQKWHLSHDSFCKWLIDFKLGLIVILQTPGETNLKWKTPNVATPSVFQCVVGEKSKQNKTFWDSMECESVTLSAFRRESSRVSGSLTAPRWSENNVWCAKAERSFRWRLLLVLTLIWTINL